MKCQTKGCKNTARIGRKICETCKSRKYKEKHPLKYTYNIFKQTAKKRKKEFTLTFEDFEEFCKNTGYDKLKGRTKFCLSIDRIDSSRGYTKDNIQAITVSNNSAKGNRSLGMREEEPPF